MGRYSEALTEAYQARMAAKLGLRAYHKGTAVRITLFLVYSLAGDMCNAWAPRRKLHKIKDITERSRCLSM